MAIVIELIRLARGTRLAAEVERFSLRVFGKEVARYTIKDAERAGIRELAEAGDRAALQHLQDLMKAIAAGSLEESLKAYDRLAVRFPSILSGVERTTFADLVTEVLKSGDRSFESLRGLLVEKLFRDLPEAVELVKSMDKIRLVANRGLKGWGPARIVIGVRDRLGRELGDLMVVSEHTDGRVWVMALVESKSLSNTRDLVEHGERAVGQHLWDYTRANATGLMIEGVYYKPSQVVLKPVPPARWTGAGAVVGLKSAAERTQELAGGLFTQFIGYAPREMTKGEIRTVAAQGIQLEVWTWPFDIPEFNRFQEELTKLTKAAVK